MSKLTFHAVSAFSKTKNASIYMAVTPSGLVSTRKILLEKGLQKTETGEYITPQGCAIVVRHVKKGEPLFGTDKETGNPLPATQDSSRVWEEGMEGFKKENEGNPIYIIGEFPKATSDYSSVLRITTISALQGEAEVKKLEAVLN